MDLGLGVHAGLNQDFRVNSECQACIYHLVRQLLVRVSPRKGGRGHVLLEDVSDGRLVIVFYCDRGLHLLLNTCNLAPHESDDLLQKRGAQGRGARARKALKLDIAASG